MELLLLVCLCLLSCSGVGAALKPNVKTLEMTKDWALLQCEAHGDPPLTAEWKDGDGTILKNKSAPKSQTGSPSYITLEITVTKTDNYSCVATQEDISHQIAASTFVYIHGAAAGPGSNTGLLMLWFLVSLFLF